MAGFSVLITNEPITVEHQQAFHTLAQNTARYKGFTQPPCTTSGVNCLAAKFDASATAHPGIIHDDQTGSWILAAGTVIALEGDNHPDLTLKRLLRDYIYNGDKALEKYDGHFAIVVYNGIEDRLSIYSDTIGMFGIFYSQQDGQVLISSSALALAKQSHSRPDILAIEHFLRLGRQDGDKTLWQDVRRLLGGKVLRATQGHFEKAEYWRPTFERSISQLHLEDALDHSVQLLTHAFGRALEREEKTWVDLTGGFDSRLAAMVVEKTKVPFQAYCTGPEDFPDVQFSRHICEVMNWEYENSQLPERWAADQYFWFNTALGCGDGRASPLKLATTLRGFQDRNTSVKTNITGVGGENFRGYRWQVEGRNIGRTSKANYDAWLNSIFAQSLNIPVNVMRTDRTGEVRKELYDFIRSWCSEYSELPNFVQIDRFEFARDSAHAGTYFSTASSIGRSLAPFFFKDLVNFAISLNYRWKFPRRHLFVRALLERENKRLADLPTSTGGPAIPMRATNLHRFMPLWKHLANRAVAVGSKKITGKSVQLWPPQDQPGYPLPGWRAAFFDYARSQDMLDHEKMYSGGLYNPKEFNAMIEQVRLGQPYSKDFLDLVITVEMAMRETGACVID